METVSNGTNCLPPIGWHYGVSYVLEAYNGMIIIVAKEPIPRREVNKIRKNCDRAVISVEEGVLRQDAETSVLGEAIASLLLLITTILRGDRNEFEELRTRYITRIGCEELRRLKRLLKESFHRLRLCSHMPLILHMANLSRVYPWLRLLYTQALRDPSYHVLLRKFSQKLVEEDMLVAWRPPYYMPINELEAKCSKEPAGLLHRATMLSQTPTTMLLQLDLSPLLDPKLIVEGVRHKPHPLLRDPFLLAKMDYARLATKLVSFENQLLVLTGASQVLKEVREERGGLIHAARIFGAGARTAVIKDYKSPLAAKWLLASILTLHLPKPILGARNRMMNEYEYTCRFLEEGLNTHEPIIIDLWRLKAAYSYIEGQSLADALKKSPVVPAYRDLGSFLATIHGKGYALWDSNPSNFIVKGLDLYVIDLEQARSSHSIEDFAWDVIMTIYYSSLYNPREIASRATMLVEGYLDAGGSKEVIIEGLKLKYAVPFFTIIPFNTIEKVRRAIGGLVE